MRGYVQFNKYTYIHTSMCVTTTKAVPVHLMYNECSSLIRTRLICAGKLMRSRSLMYPCCKAVKDDSRKHTVNLFLLLLPRRMPNDL